MVLVPRVVDSVAPIPVVASGGIADGRGCAAALALGAEGVVLGTRLIATTESDAHGVYKQKVLAASEEDNCAHHSVWKRLAPCSPSYIAYSIC
jgi:nitronate monooxygenase